MNNEFTNKLSSLLPEIFLENFSINQLRPCLNCWSENTEEFINFYYLLSDNKSKELFIKLLRYNIAYSFLGDSSKEKYGIFKINKWNELLENAKNKKYGGIDGDYILDRVEVYELEGYKYDDICKVNKGDYVFDCGAFTGNTAIYFSNQAKENGKVFSFEAMPETFNTLSKNIINYKNIFTYNYGVVDKSKKLRFTKVANAASHVTESSNYIEVKGISLDEFVEKNNIKKVDFIKMDIEGSELEALNGCKNICKRFFPKLAVCIYHKPEDWITIPKKILELNKNYKFYLKHNSNNFWETVLFAVPSNNKEKIICHNEREICKNILETVINLHKNININLRKNLINKYIKNIHLFKKIKEEYDSCFNYVYFPLSNDKKLHYELLFTGKGIKICLHLEGKYNNQYNIFEGLENKIDIMSDVIFYNGKFNLGYEISFKTNKIYDVKLITNIFNFLVDNTKNILIKNKIISSNIIFNII